MSENTQNESFWIKALMLYHESKEAAVDRLKMPMIPYYLALLVLSYWEPLYILIFSSKPVEDRTAYVRCMFQNFTIYDHLNCFLFALIFAVISSILFPYLTIFINRVNQTSEKAAKRSKELFEREKIFHELELESIKSGRKEKEEFNKTIDDLKQSYEQRIESITSNHNIEIENLKETNTSQTELIKELDKKILSFSTSNPKFSTTKKTNNTKSINTEENIIIDFNTYKEIQNFLIRSFRKPLTLLEEIKNNDFQILFNNERPLKSIENALFEKFQKNNLGEMITLADQSKTFSFTTSGRFLIMSLISDFN
ncbi:hypothetical protein SAMN05421741_10394 [Paenimyroides ummariense]|uniref:Uncharacterized protein n=1 Tax=Paenimyroides ummariense TaxID=913024 RepID=A0A1I4XQR8_9FLAO|nr:hypothetical protein [Paenimyroides ummariense]SFN28204.1 hypothetical protein SAMN05421741_10394 [Paenimyroides ummariense]